MTDIFSRRKRLKSKKEEVKSSQKIHKTIMPVNIEMVPVLCTMQAELTYGLLLTMH